MLKKIKFSEEDAVAQFQDGVQSAGAFVFNKYKNEIRSLAYGYARSREERQKLEGELIVAFSKCMKNFNFERNLSFEYYFMQAVTKTINNYLKRKLA